MVSDVDILMITYNRPEYTRKTLARLLATCDDRSRVWVWHNGEHAETLDVVHSFSVHPKFHRFYHSSANAKLREPTNWIYENGTGDFVGKVDDDCLVDQGWIEAFRSMHECERRLAVVACWHFRPEDYDAHMAAGRIVRLADGSGLLQNPWVGGSGYLLKRECIRRHGVIGPKMSSTDYWLQLFRAGWLLGWRVPLILQDHMDDPRSEHSMVKTDEEFRKRIPLSARTRGTATVADWDKQLRASACMVQRAPLNASFYSPMRRKWRSLVARVSARFGLARPQW